MPFCEYGTTQLIFSIENARAVFECLEERSPAIIFEPDFQQISLDEKNTQINGWALLTLDYQNEIVILITWTCAIWMGVPV